MYWFFVSIPLGMGSMALVSLQQFLEGVLALFKSLPSKGQIFGKTSAYFGGILNVIECERDLGGFKMIPVTFIWIMLSLIAVGMPIVFALARHP